MAETFLILLIGIITIGLSSLLFALININSMCEEEEEKWRKRKRKK